MDMATPRETRDRKVEERPVRIPTDKVVLQGDLVVPPNPHGLVIFAHGSGSSRLSPRNRHVAQALQRKGLATLLFDLLTADEEQREQFTAHLRFDIALLSRRLVEVTAWALRNEQTKGLSIGYFGASTGAAAALVAAAQLSDAVSAVVSRGGRPDLAGPALDRVKAPTLLIVGGQDHQVIEMNRRAFRELKAAKQLVIIPGATHLFEEPGTMDEVARLAGEWFAKRLVPVVRSQEPEASSW